MKNIFIAFAFLLPAYASAQGQEGTLLLYNTGFGAVSAAVGAVINKPRQTNWRKAALTGFWQGGIGGLLNYTSKKTLYVINQQQAYVYAWPAKILHAAGYSIIENAAYCRPFLHSWNIDFGPARFDYNIDAPKRIKVRFLPLAVYSFYEGTTFGRFNISTTLLTGTMCFVSHNSSFTFNGNKYSGFSFGRTIAYIDHKDTDPYHVIAHEMAHNFQHSEYMIFNSWLTPLIPKHKYKTVTNLFARHIYFDVPYFYPIYDITSHDYNHYYRNFYEFEAERFATNRHIYR